VLFDSIRRVKAPENIFSALCVFFFVSEGWLEPCKRYSESVIKRFALVHRSFVVEIGSNDGHLLHISIDTNVEIASNDGYLLLYFKTKTFPFPLSSQQKKQPRRPSKRAFLLT
jgi:hypothetical protein